MGKTVSSGTPILRDMRHLHNRGPGAPRHWIGIEKGWQEKGGDPLDRLVSLAPRDLRTHALLIGATGSGKTNLIHHMIAQDVLLGHSFAVLDLRGDLVMAALGICAGRVPPERVKVLDLRSHFAPSGGFDPLHGAGEPYFRALGVLDAIRAESESWGVQLEETLRYALLLLAGTGRRLTNIPSLLYSHEFLAECLDACEDRPTAEFWERYAALPHERQSALATPVMNKVSALWSVPSLRKILGHPRPMDVGKHLNEPGGAFLVSLAADELHSVGRAMGRIVLTSLCREVFARVSVPEGQRVPLRLYVDEFEHFGEREFETLLAEGRRFGLSLVLAHQTLAQLTPKMRSIVLGNVGTKVAFRLGREDASTVSRDLAGDPKAYDFTALKTGEAVLWTRERGCVEIETNAPIVDPEDAGEGAFQLLARVKELAKPPARPPAPESEDPFARKPRRAFRRVTEPPASDIPESTIGRNLEDLLR